MFKKLLVILLAIGFIVSIAGRADAILDGRYRVVPVIITSSQVLASTTFDVTKDVLVGINVIGANGAVVGLYDITAIGSQSSSNIKDEDEALSTIATYPVWYPYPIQFSSGLGVQLSSTMTSVTLYIVKDWNKYSS